jgi:SOS-response transcriptional repressor LexA
MLSDIQLKTLRMITNMDKLKGRTPTVQELCVKTGRNERKIIKVLQELHEANQIRWDPEKRTIQLVNPYTIKTLPGRN